jgi:hypothetical protein
MRGETVLPSREEHEGHLLRATSGNGIVPLHDTITRYAIERVRHLLDEAEYAHMVGCWVEFLGAKAAQVPPADTSGGPAPEYESFYRSFSKRQEEPVLACLSGLVRSEEGRRQLGRFLIKGVCDRYRGEYNPHYLTGLGSALWVVNRYHDRPPIVRNALRQYLNYFFTDLAS